MKIERQNTMDFNEFAKKCEAGELNRVQIINELQRYTSQMNKQKLNEKAQLRCSYSDEIWALRSRLSELEGAQSVKKFKVKSVKGQVERSSECAGYLLSEWTTGRGSYTRKRDVPDYVKCEKGHGVSGRATMYIVDIDKVRQAIRDEKKALKADEKKLEKIVKKANKWIERVTANHAKARDVRLTNIELLEGLLK